MANAVPVSGEWTDAPEIPSVTAEHPRTVTVFVAQKKLNIVLPFIESDTPNVIRLLKWCAELSGKVPYTLFLLPFKGLNFTEVKMYAERAFTDVQVIEDGEGVTSDWKTDSQIRDAAGPNSMFRQAAWFFYFHQGLGSWLYLEPDCVPLKKDWVDQLKADHFASGSLISGQKMSVGGKPYLNGVAIYPPNVINEAPEIVTQVMWQAHPEMEIAFDIAGGDKVLQKAHLTDKIQLEYRSNGRVEFQKAGAVLYHGDRTGTLIESLSAAGYTVPNQRQPAEPVSDSPLNDPGIPLLGASDESRADNGAAGNSPVVTLKRYKLEDGKYIEIKPEEMERSEPNPAYQTPTIGEEIRYHCDELLRIVSDKASRKDRILDELRKRKLVPHARHRK